MRLESFYGAVTRRTPRGIGKLHRRPETGKVQRFRLSAPTERTDDPIEHPEPFAATLEEDVVWHGMRDVVAGSAPGKSVHPRN